MASLYGMGFHQSPSDIFGHDSALKGPHSVHSVGRPQSLLPQGPHLTVAPESRQTKFSVKVLTANVRSAIHGFR